jgi:putative DNA primase/helicase
MPQPISDQSSRDNLSYPSPTLGQAAVRYAAAGWPVFPLHDASDGVCSCAAGPNCRKPGKHPRTTNGFNDATVDPTRTGIWWARWPHANIGVATGQASGLVVVDLDGDAGHRSWARLLDEHDPTPDTATVMTPHGTHLWYRLPSGVTVPRSIGVRERLDILGDGGYAVVPPSRIPCGKPEEMHQPGPCTDGYAWTRRGTIAVLPGWVADLAHERTAEQSETPAPVREAMRAAGRTSYGQAAINGEAARVASAPAGTRNDTLNAAAWRLGRLAGGGELDVRHAAEALWEAARGCGLVDDDGAGQVMRTIDSGLQAGMKQPRTRRQRDNQAVAEKGRAADEHRSRDGPCAGQRNLGITL